MPFSLDDLRRWPDLEGPDLVAVDPADRLILDESAAARADVPDSGLVVMRTRRSAAASSSHAPSVLIIADRS